MCHCATKPCKTLRSILIHPKDKEDKKQTSECVYKVPCANCDKTYVGETGRKLGVRLQEHRTEVEFKTKWAFTRSQRSSTSAEYNKSALTDHALQENHVINWSDASVIDREPDRATRWIREAIHIRKEGQQAMNRKEGSYQLSHAYDRFLGTGLSYCAKNRKKKWLFSFSWRRLPVEVETLRYKQFLVVIDEFITVQKCMRQHHTVMIN